MVNNFTPIQITGPTRLLVPLPTEQATLDAITVTVVDRTNELHFIVRHGYDGEAMRTGHVAGTCMSVLRAFSDQCIGRRIDQLYFYSRIDGDWNKISFEIFDVDRVGAPWPDYDAGEAMGNPVVYPLYQSLVDAPLQDDYHADAFAYWWHAAHSFDMAEVRLADPVGQFLRDCRQNRSFGRLTYDVHENRKVEWVFAKSRNVLMQHVARIESTHRTHGHTVVLRGHRNRGWVCGIFVVDSEETGYTLLEPGEHVITDHELAAWQAMERFTYAGGRHQQDTDGRILVSLPDDVDLSTLDGPWNGGPCVLIRKGEHVFNVSRLVENQDVWF